MSEGYTKKCPVCNEEFTCQNNRQLCCSKKCAAVKGISVQKTCMECGNEFSAKSNASKLCSKECKDKYKREHRIAAVKHCLHCGIEFNARNKDQEFCSKDCNYNHTYECTCIICDTKFAGKQSSTKYCSANCRHKDVDDVRICKHCSKEFYGNRATRLNSEYCSLQCRNEHPKAETEIKPCSHCGKDMIIYPHHITNGRGKFCSVECQMLGGREGTDIEIIVKQWLDSHNINYEYQHHLDDKYFPDFYFPDFKMVIEVQGDYWHGNPKVYKPEDLNDCQVDHIKRDRRKMGYYKSRGIKCYELWGIDIKDDIESLMRTIKEIA